MPINPGIAVTPKKLPAPAPLSPLRSDRPRHRSNRKLTEGGRLLLIATMAAALSWNFAFAQQPNDDRCKAEETNRQTDGKQAQGRQTPLATNNPSQKLSDCGGVLKPPTVGDSKMEKPAPQVGNTPVIKPGDTQQQNNQQPSK